MEKLSLFFNSLLYPQFEHSACQLAFSQWVFFCRRVNVCMCEGEREEGQKQRGEETDIGTGEQVHIAKEQDNIF